MRNLARQAVFGPNQEETREKIKKFAMDAGIVLSSTQALYEKIGRGEVSGFTVPAFNLRTLTFDVSCAVFRVAKKEKAGPFIFELARSEMAYTDQTPAEFSACVLAGAIEEKWQGSIFLQGDHFKIKKDNFLANPEKEITDLENLIREAIMAGFYNIDIDCSALPLADNIKYTSHFVNFIRKVQPQDITVSIGGEIGEIGKENTTNEQLREFLFGLQKEMLHFGNEKGIIKVAVQNGTSHGRGGKIDWGTFQTLVEEAKSLGMAGVVQHGASTLPEKDFEWFSKLGVCEIHLATELQNIILESKYFPKELRKKIPSKRELGKYKKEIWLIPQKDIDKICKELENKFRFFFKNLKVSDTRGLMNAE